MLYRRLGNSGLQISALSFGAWVTFGRQIADTAARDLMHAAYDAGVNFFDNAETYADGQAELVMGKILKDAGWPRSAWLVSSKVYFGWEDDKPNQTGLSRKHIVEACHAALRRLQVDYLDLYYCHRPDPNVPIAETARAMHDLIVQGKVLYWGTSEWPADAIKQAHQICAAQNLHPPIVEQPQYNLLHRSRVEKEYASLFRTPVGLGLTTWSPLASGLLTGKYTAASAPSDARLSAPGLEWLRDLLLKQPGAERKLAAIPALSAVAQDLGTNLPRLAVVWALKNLNVSSVILGASRVEQLRENLGALDLLPQLTPEVVSRLEKISAPVAT